MRNFYWLVCFLLIVPLIVFGDYKFPGFDEDPYWTGQVDSTEEEINPRAEISYVSDPVIVGESAMRIEWGVINDQDWGGNVSLRYFHIDSLEVFDFSEGGEKIAHVSIENLKAARAAAVLEHCRCGWNLGGKIVR